MSSKSALEHASETINTLTHHTPSQALSSCLHRARHSLLCTPSHTTLPHNLVVCTIALAPFTHYTHPQHLLISRISEEPKAKKMSRSKSKSLKESVFLKIPLPSGGLDAFLREFACLQERVGDSVEPCEIHKWWAARRQLDTEMKVSSLRTLRSVRIELVPSLFL